MLLKVADIPHLVALWDEAKNLPVRAKELSAQNYRPAWWLCTKGHSFQRSPRMMQGDPSCPRCKVAGRATFADKYPALAALWDEQKNAGLKASDVDATHAGGCWWRCAAAGHSFQRAPLLMVKGSECPTCALAASSLAKLYPVVAAEWNVERNGEVTPDRVEADHLMNAWWRCSKGHEYQATVRARAKGGKRCPTCYGGWSVEVIRAFVHDLLPHVHALNPSEKFALAMQAGLLRERDSRPFVQAFVSGRFPVDELERFARGEPSAVDGFAAPLVLENPVLPSPKAAKPDDPYALPAAPEPQDVGVIDVEHAGLTQHAQGSTTGGATPAEGSPADGEADLPLVRASDALSALDNVLIANADAETVKFLLDSAKAKLWRHAYTNPQEARAEAAAFKGDTYSSLVRDQFLTEVDEAEALSLPAGYSFRPTADAPVTPPNLMQRRVAVCIRQSRRFGNWSGMGAGKTLSAILATRVVDAGLTIICCPNAVVGNWGIEIKKSFANADVVEKTWTPAWSPAAGDAAAPATPPRYLVLNYEQFQQPESEQKLVAFLAQNVIDFVVVDEIHYTKQRDPSGAMSKRKRLVQALVLEAAKKNADVCVLGMSGTPVINNLAEGRSLVELITGHRHDDLETTATVQNCMRLYQRLVTLGTRWRPDYRIQLEVTRVPVDCSGDLEEIREVGRGTTLQLEQVLTRLRTPVIVENIGANEKVVVYTHYVDGIVKPLADALKDAGHRVGMLTGDTDDGDLAEFKKPDGRVNVLIASSRIATGVDGLQHVCSKLIINALPWTNAEYEQLVGRLYRQGSRFEKVKVIIPVTSAVVNGERWSYCESKLNRIEYKRSIADAAVDGIVPEGNLRTPAQAQQDIMSWLERLKGGAMATVERRQIEIPLSGDPAEVTRRMGAYGDFTRMNNRWYQSSSQKTHARLAANPEEWGHYHTMYRELRKSWPVIPFEEEIRWLDQREGQVVGDFGCGEAIIAARMKEKHTVYSVDHVAVNRDVIACDMAAVPLENDALDVAIFCLSLMGANCTEYIREARRCLRLDGQLHIWEPANYFADVDAFCRDLEKLGFDVVEPRTEGAFVRIYAVRNSAKPVPGVALRFRGAGEGGSADSA